MPTKISIFDELHTIGDWWRYALSRFNEAQLYFGHGCTNAADEAAYLVLHSLHLPLDDMSNVFSCRLTQEERRRIYELIRQRIETRLPMPYITHEAWLKDYSFYVDERVLIPRSFIAELMPDSLNQWIEYPELIHSALDLCTGSGCLAILLAQYYPDAAIDALDISQDALDVARINIDCYGLQDRIRLIQSDVFSGLDPSSHKYDLIISNPPYVDDDAMNTLPQEYQHEPSLALASGNDGLDCIRTILLNAPRFLNAQGVLVVEVGHQKELVESCYPDLPFTWLPTQSGDGFVFLLQQEDFT